MILNGNANPQFTDIIFKFAFANSKFANAIYVYVVAKYNIAKVYSQYTFNIL